MSSNVEFQMAVTLQTLGVPIGPIAYGCWRLDGRNLRQAQENIETALECEMTIVDTADIYGIDQPGGFGSAELGLGEVFRQAPSLRQQMILATKGGILPPTPYNSSEAYIITACEASLKRLGTDVIDLYQIHRPDLLAHPASIVSAFEQLHRDGKVRTFGVSNYSPSQTAALMKFCNVPFVSVQSAFSAWTIDPITDGTLDQCIERDLTCLAWSPLAGGALASGHPSDGMDRDALHRLTQALDHIATKHSVGRTEVALAFLLRHPAIVIPIIGTQNAKHIRQASRATSISLSRREWYSILEARRGAPMP